MNQRESARFRRIALLRENRPDRLHNRTVNLPLDYHWVDFLSTIVYAHIFQNPDEACFAIHLHFTYVSCARSRKAFWLEISSGFKRRLHSLWDIMSFVCCFCELCE